MGRNRLFKKYVNAALIRLRVEKTVHRLQTGLFWAHLVLYSSYLFLECLSFLITGVLQ